MRRFLAYIVMMLTMVCALVFNTQTVLQQKTDAMEYGSGTELVYSLTKRDASGYDQEGYPDIRDNGTKDLQDIDIEKEVMDRLDLAGVRNANVKIVNGKEDTQEGYQLRISLSPLNENDLNYVKEVINMTGTLSIATIGDDTVMYQAADQFFDDSSSTTDMSTIVYNGTVPYPTIKVNKEDYDTLKTKSSEAADAHSNDTTSEAHRFYAEGDEEEEEDNSTTVYLWYNKTKDDTYDKAFGTNDTIVQDAVKNKVIAKIDLDNYDSDTNRLSIVSDIDGNAWNISSARAFVNMLNAEDYGFDIDFLYQNSVKATFGSNDKGLIRTYIVSGVVLLIIVALLIAFYGLSGVTASLTMLASVLISFFLFSVLGFEFSVAALIGLVVLVTQSLLISLNYFERVKREQKKGRDLEKANKEGYHKSFFTSLDISAIVLLSSIFSFLIAVGSYKTFFGVIMVGSIFTFIITNYVNKWMLYWLCKDVHDVDNKMVFGRRSDKEPKKVKFVNSESKGKRKSLLFAPIAALIALGIALPTSFFLSKDSSFFNNYNDFSDTYTVNLAFQGEAGATYYDKLSTKEVYINYLKKIGTLEDNEGYVMYSSDEKLPSDADTSLPSFTYKPDSVFVNVVDKKDEDGVTYYIHYFTMTVNKDISSLTTEDGKDVLTVITEAMQYKDVEGVEDVTGGIAPCTSYRYADDTLATFCSLTKPTNVTHNYTSLFLLVFLFSCFAFVYLLCRYGLSISLASLCAGTGLSAVGILLLVVLRVPFSSFTGFGLLASVILIEMLSVLLLGGNKETLKELGIKKTADASQREEIADQCAVTSAKIIVPACMFFVLMGIGIFFINTGVIGLSISMILFGILVPVILFFYIVSLYHFLATHISFRKISESIHEKRVKKGKSTEKVYSKDGIAYVDPDSPHETIIVGLNEFRGDF